jgi:hypothetical protein
MKTAPAPLHGMAQEPSSYHHFFIRIMIFNY